MNASSPDSKFTLIQGSPQQPKAPAAKSAAIATAVHPPLEVELLHPALGQLRASAQELPELGLLVQCQPPHLRAGARVKVRILHCNLAEHLPSPTLEMQVDHLAGDGLALKFCNQTARHLWTSLQQPRTELDQQLDYFQVFQVAVISNSLGRVLLVQQQGRWLFPGTYLQVGQAWQSTLTDYVASTLNIPDLEFRTTLSLDTGMAPMAKENAVLSLYHHFLTSSSRCELDPAAKYKHARWVGRQAEADELSFAQPALRSLTRELLQQFAAKPA